MSQSLIATRGNNWWISAFRLIGWRASCCEKYLQPQVGAGIIRITLAIGPDLLSGSHVGRNRLVCSTYPPIYIIYNTQTRASCKCILETAVYGEQLIISMRNKTQVIGNTIFIWTLGECKNFWTDVQWVLPRQEFLPRTHGKHFLWACFWDRQSQNNEGSTI